MYNPYEEIEVVAIYLRKSRENEEKDVLIKHRTELVGLAEKFKWKYIIYEEVVSGDTISSRPQMQKLLQDLQDDLYDAVLVIDIDRLGRGEQEDQGLIKKVFSKTNTLIITPSKLYNLNEETDEDYYDMQAFMARQEYKMIKRRFKRGKKIGARLGRWTNGIPPIPYVYDSKSKSLLINEDLKPIYLKIKELFLTTGMGTNSIAWELNKLGIPTPRNGKMWYANTVFRLLIDETHLGRIISNKTKGNIRKGEQIINLPRDQWTIIDNCHEAIKTMEEHELILQKLESFKKTPNRAKQGVFAFSGLLYCSECGRRMQFSRKVYDKNEVFAKCSTYSPTGKKCSTVGCKERVILDGLKEFICQFDIDSIKVKNKSKANQDDGLLNLKLKEEQKLREEIAKIFNAYEKGVYTDEEFVKRKRVKHNELTSCQLQIKELKKEIKTNVGVPREKFISTIENLKKLDQLSPKELNELFKDIFEKFIYTRDSLKDNPIVKPIFLPLED